MRYATLLAAALIMPALAAAADPPKNAPPIEPPADPKATKIVLIAGSNYYKAGEHDYVANCAVLADLLKQTPNVAPVLALDWPKKADTLDNAKAVVFLFDGAEKHQALKGERLAQVQKLMDAKAGLVQFHQTADYPKDFGAKAREWSGGAWEKGAGERAHWVTTFDRFPEHPVCNGVKPFKIDDGYLFKNTFVAGMKGVTPVLRTWNPKTTAKPTGGQDVVAWTYERPEGGRAFTFTGAHLHASFAEEGYRRLLVNGILWAAGVDVPKEGAKVDLDPSELPKYLKPAPAKK
ncbi:Trehalose utilization [Gemmata obscuriglobus]|uniref:Trehalose utilization n=1 Tax=Gemmata obscuriglobus TaxID=114 RepID=A0A2Z3H896_9BACT|nr:ThuA domain-containing protein [Gemmata obscuriglobus]AWM40622.1 trehalose utilization [Gemmata obscuriglobus]QEG26116.1 Trehalose utilization [Gemmata obscuriglobus]VTS00631.1 Trehalose utilization OS=Singulisphaera acidiphila (strain ATCC BAA-1392 / DSM 18658 / VKM B-2454 / MOB10) GN=Sinac_4741 PE=4 SV=1: ThuA [Gemmata obscuriglobus UQM 2246]